MQKQRRWMKWILEEAETNTVAMPWDRKAGSSDWKHNLAENKPEKVRASA